MDPNAALEELRRITRRASAGDFERMCELVEALDGWISGGGFLPGGWANMSRSVSELGRALSIARALFIMASTSRETDVEARAHAAWTLHNTEYTRKALERAIARNETKRAEAEKHFDRAVGSQLSKGSVR